MARHMLGRGWAAALDCRIERLDRLRHGPTDCIGCGCMSIDHCPLRNRGDRPAGRG